MWSAIIQAIDHAMDRMNKGFGAGIQVAQSQNGNNATEEQPTTEQTDNIGLKGLIKKPTEQSTENKDDTILSDKDTKDSKAAGEAKKTSSKWHTTKNYATNLSKSFANAAALATKQKKPYELETSDVDFSLEDDKDEEEEKKKDV